MNSNRKERQSRLRIRPAGGSSTDVRSQFADESHEALDLCRQMAVEHQTACVVESWHRGSGQDTWTLIAGFNDRGQPCEFKILRRPFPHG